MTLFFGAPRFLHTALLTKTDAKPMKNSPPHSAVTDERRPAQRSAVTNGRRLFVEGDERSAWARRFRDVLDLQLSDMGGSDAVSVAKASIARRAAFLTVELEQIEARFSDGGGDPAELELYQRTANSLRRLLETIGLERVPKDVTPNIHEYLDSKRVGTEQ